MKSYYSVLMASVVAAGCPDADLGNIDETRGACQEGLEGIRLVAFSGDHVACESARDCTVHRFSMSCPAYIPTGDEKPENVPWVDVDLCHQPVNASRISDVEQTIRMAGGLSCVVMLESNLGEACIARNEVGARECPPHSSAVCVDGVCMSDVP